MALKLVDESAPVVTLAQAKKQVRAEHHTDDDAYLESLLEVATSYIQKLTGRSLGDQTWEYFLDAFPVGAIRIPMPPLQSVTGVYYVDADGVEQTLPTNQYQVDVVSEPGWVVPVAGAGWPCPMETVNAVRIRFVAGYDPVPASIRHAILLLVGAWYEAREAASEVDHKPIPFGVAMLIDQYRERAF